MAIGNIPKTKAESKTFFDNAAQAAAAQGAAAGTGVSVSSVAFGVQKTTLTFANTLLPMVDNAGVVAYAGLKIFDFPAGVIVIEGAVANLALTKSSAGVIATWDGDFGVGTVTATSDNALATTEQNVIPTTATPQAVSGATTAKGASTAEAQFDGTATAIDLFLNVLVDDADHDVTGTPCDLIVNGTIEITWANLGDN